MTEINNDHDLIERFNDGDESAVNELVRKYQHRIYWHARRMTGNHLDADEIVQEVLLVMFKKLKNFKFRSSLYTWIYTITSTRSINLLRRRSIQEIFSLQDSGVDRAADSDIIKDFETKEEIRKYIEGELSGEELINFEKEINNSPELKKEIDSLRNVLNQFKKLKNVNADENYFTNILPRFRESTYKQKQLRIKPSFAVGSILIVLITIIVFFITTNKEDAIEDEQITLQQLDNEERSEEH